MMMKQKYYLVGLLIFTLIGISFLTIVFDSFYDWFGIRTGNLLLLISSGYILCLCFWVNPMIKTNLLLNKNKSVNG